MVFACERQLLLYNIGYIQFSKDSAAVFPTSGVFNLPRAYSIVRFPIYLDEFWRLETTRLAIIQPKWMIFLLSPGEFCSEFAGIPMTKMTKVLKIFCGSLGSIE